MNTRESFYSIGQPYYLFDAPGITGNRLRLKAHLDAGGEVVHKVNAEGFLENPEAIWPGRGLKGKKVKPDGTVVE